MWRHDVEWRSYQSPGFFFVFFAVKRKRPEADEFGSAHFNSSKVLEAHKIAQQHISVCNVRRDAVTAISGCNQ